MRGTRFEVVKTGLSVSQAAYYLGTRVNLAAVFLSGLKVCLAISMYQDSCAVNSYQRELRTLSS